MSSSQFIKEHSQKIFITNHAPDCSTRELLSAAMGPLSGLKNPTTGRKIWQIERPMPLENQTRGLYVYAVATYPVASIGGTVGLTLGAIPQAEANIQIVAVLQDSMGWEIPMAEQIADAAMVMVDRGITGRYPQHGGWAMTAGAWRIGHHFVAPEGVPADPPALAQAEQQEQPEDFFYNPATARVWGANFPLGPAQHLVNLAVQALQNQDQGWKLEFFTEDVDGVGIPCFNGHLLLPAGGVLYLNGFCQQQVNTMMLMAQFADIGLWTATSTTQAMQHAASSMNTSLQQNYGVALRLLPPPR